MRPGSGSHQRRGLMRPEVDDRSISARSRGGARRPRAARRRKRMRPSRSSRSSPPGAAGRRPGVAAIADAMTVRVLRRASTLDARPNPVPTPRPTSPTPPAMRLSAPALLSLPGVEQVAGQSLRRRRTRCRARCRCRRGHRGRRGSHRCMTGACTTGLVRKPRHIDFQTDFASGVICTTRSNAFFPGAEATMVRAGIDRQRRAPLPATDVEAVARHLDPGLHCAQRDRERQQLPARASRDRAPSSRAV